MTAAADEVDTGVDAEQFAQSLDGGRTKSGGIAVAVAAVKLLAPVGHGHPHMGEGSERIPWEVWPKPLRRFQGVGRIGDGGKSQTLTRLGDFAGDSFHQTDCCGTAFWHILERC